MTVNKLGDGRAFYLAAQTEERFLDVFNGKVVEGLGLPLATGGELPEGVSATIRGDRKNRFLFVMNFASEIRRVDLGTAG